MWRHELYNEQWPDNNGHLTIERDDDRLATLLARRHPQLAGTSADVIAAALAQALITRA